MEERDGEQFFIQFTEEEEQVKKELLKKHFGTNEENYRTIYAKNI